MMKLSTIFPYSLSSQLIINVLFKEVCEQIKYWEEFNCHVSAASCQLHMKTQRHRISERITETAQPGFHSLSTHLYPVLAELCDTAQDRLGSFDFIPTSSFG